MRLNVAVYNNAVIDMLYYCTYLGEDPSLDCGKISVDVENGVYVFELREIYAPIIEVNRPLASTLCNWLNNM
jgi:hypothetical protein